MEFKLPLLDKLKILMKKIYMPIFLSLLLVNCTNKQELKEYYPDGTLKIKYTKIDNKKDGKCTQFYKSGKVQLEYSFKDDFANGPFTSYYENGNIKQKGQFIWGSPNGKYFYYNNFNKLDSIIEFILRPEGTTTYEYLERDTITKEIASKAIVCKNSVVIFDTKGKMDMKKSLYYEVSFDNKIKNDSMEFSLSFSNPYEYYKYRSDSIEILTYVNSIRESEINYIVLSRKNPINITGKHAVKKGYNFFYAIISLHRNDTSTREILIKVPFITEKFRNNVGKQVFTSINNPPS